MSKKSSNLVTVAKPVAAGAISSAPTGTTLPTDATTALDAAFVSLGHVSEDGLTNSVETDVEEIKAWGGDTVLTVRTSRSETFGFTLIQSLDTDVLKVVYGESNVDGGGAKAITVKHNGKPLGRRSWVFEMVMTGDRIKRVVVPAGEITEVGEVAYKDGEPVGYEVTLAALPDAEDNTAYEYVTAAPKA